MYVNHGEIEKVGRQLHNLAQQVNQETDKHFHSMGHAAWGNRGFTSGTELGKLADELHREITGAIDDLSGNAERIVEAAQAYATTERDNTGGLIREVDALRSIGQDR